MKKSAGQIDATPTKRVFSSIIADYNLNTGVCELVDNAIDLWTRNERSHALRIDIHIELDQQTLRVIDNAGGLEKDDLGIIVTPGSSTLSGKTESIGIFGVGAKRAVVALAQKVEIRTRHKNGKTHLVEIDDHWIGDPEWDLEMYVTDNINPSSTIIELSKLRFRIDEQDVKFLKEHLRATYAMFLKQSNCEIWLDSEKLTPLTFENWSYPPGYSPRRFSGDVLTEDDETLTLRAVAGLIKEKGSIAGEYGVYFYCNNRLVSRALKSYDVGFVAGLAGAPHNVVSLVRVIIHLNGPSRCMPWNSSKSAINANHRTFKVIQKWLTQTVTGFANVSKRFHGEWEKKVFRYSSGNYIDVEIANFEKVKKAFLPPLPPKRVKYEVALHKKNERLLKKKPWVRGVYEADVAVELVQKQKFEQKNRLSLILLDSSLEIAFKDFLVNESGQYFTDTQLLQLFGSRHKVETEVQKYVKIGSDVWKKLKFYYGLRCKLVHERSTAEITNGQIEEFRSAVHKVLSKLFKLKWVSHA